VRVKISLTLSLSQRERAIEVVQSRGELGATALARELRNLVVPCYPPRLLWDNFSDALLGIASVLQNAIHGSCERLDGVGLG
jgi:hypothetical protein